MNEKIYKTMLTVGGLSIAMGIVVLVVGVTIGVGSIVGGASLLKRKSDVTF